MNKQKQIKLKPGERRLFASDLRLHFPKTQLRVMDFWLESEDLIRLEIVHASHPDIVLYHTDFTLEELEDSMLEYNRTIPKWDGQFFLDVDGNHYDVTIQELVADGWVSESDCYTLLINNLAPHQYCVMSQRQFENARPLLKQLHFDFVKRMAHAKWPEWFKQVFYSIQYNIPPSSYGNMLPRTRSFCKSKQSKKQQRNEQTNSPHRFSTRRTG